MSEHPLVTELLGRIDAATATMPTDTARRVFLGGQLEKAQARFASFVRAAESRFTPPAPPPPGMPPITAVDHHSAMAGISARIAELTEQVAA